MKKNIIFATGGMLIGGGVGFFMGRLTYKKKLDKAEMDIETLLKEINRPEEDSEVSDDEDTEEEEAAEDADVKKGVESPSKSSKSYGSVKEKESVDYDSFYSGYKSNYILKSNGTGEESGVDPAEKESPEEESDDDDYADLSSVARPDDDDIWETEAEREYRLRKELMDAGLLITKDNENYEAGKEMTRSLNSGRKPRVISKESYYSETDYPHHQKCILDYYARNDVLVDTESEEEIHNEYECVGDCMDKYGYRDDDEQTILYVRNFSYGIDYLISKTFDPYYGE